MVLDRCTFVGCNIGAMVSGVEARFENCSFSTNTEDVSIVSDGHAVMVNCSFDPAKMDPADIGDQWSAWWTVHVKVKFPSGGAAAGALVTVKDLKGTSVFSDYANGDGFIANIMILEHVTTETVRDARSPHTFNATLGLSTNEADIDVTGHLLVTMEIADDSPPMLTITSHSNGDHIRTPVLTLQGTAVDTGSSLSLIHI